MRKLKLSDLQLVSKRGWNLFEAKYALKELLALRKDIAERDIASTSEGARELINAGTKGDVRVACFALLSLKSKTSVLVGPRLSSAGEDQRCRRFPSFKSQVSALSTQTIHNRRVISKLPIH